MTTTAMDGVRDTALVLSRVAIGAQMRVERHTWQQIADALGYGSRGAASNAVLGYVRRLARGNANQLRDIENLKLDDDEAELLILRDDPDVDPRVKVMAIRTRLDLSARRSRLNGLDSPLQVQLSAGVAADLEDALAELEQQVTGGATVPGEVSDVRDELPEA